MTTPSNHSKAANPGAFSYLLAILAAMGMVFALAYFALPALFSVSYSEFDQHATSTGLFGGKKESTTPPLDRVAYDKKLLELSHVASSSPWRFAFLAATSTVTLPGATTSIKVAKKSWPARAAYPADSRALLPFNRIVSYYGNFYSKYMGVLGEYPEEEMLTRLRAAVAEWEAADPATPVIPAIH
ncbi:MAG: hypothetical protein V4436_01785, partial [Patescibacteria group bacterium]